MTILYILLPLFGALPLVIITVKMRKAQHIKNNGVPTDAEVVQIKPLPKRTVTLILQYEAGPKREVFNGKATAGYGEYNIGDKLPIFYLRDNPSKMTTKDQKGYYFLLIFTMLIFLFILFVTYKMPELMNGGM